MEPIRPRTAGQMNDWEAFQSYFAIFPWDRLPPDAVGFDFGCGDGRWAQFVARGVGRLHCIDPNAEALSVAKRNLDGLANCEFHVAAADRIPLPDASADFGYSLGVLCHLPNPQMALTACVGKLKQGAPFFLYLYYTFDYRPAWFRLLWRLTEAGRFAMGRLPCSLHHAATQLIATAVYLPSTRTALMVEDRGLPSKLFSYLDCRDRNRSVLPTGVSDRFGLRVELRFTRRQMRRMMELAGLEKITFSESPPFSCAVGIKS